ncbi:hypothetical protein CR513_43754, partial [Mucuna pruriens]
MNDELSSKRPTLILGRPFLKIAKTKIDVHFRKLFMEFGDNRMEYIIFEAMKHPTKNHSIFYLDVIDQLDDDYMNLHYEFPGLDDFKDCNCICTKLTKYLICVEISDAINASGGVVEVVVVQPPLPSIVKPLQLPIIIANKIQIEQNKNRGDFYEHHIKHSTLSHFERLSNN